MVMLKYLTSDFIFKEMFFNRDTLLIRMIKDILLFDKEVTIKEKKLFPCDNGRWKAKVKLSDDSLITIIMIETPKEIESDTFSRYIMHVVKQKNNIPKELEPTISGYIEAFAYAMPEAQYLFNKEPYESFILTRRNEFNKIQECAKFYSINIDKCFAAVLGGKYKDYEDNAYNIVKWGALFATPLPEAMSEIIGDKIMTKEEKADFLKHFKALDQDPKILEALSEEWSKMGFPTKGEDGKPHQIALVYNPNIPNENK